MNFLPRYWVKLQSRLPRCLLSCWAMQSELWACTRAERTLWTGQPQAEGGASGHRIWSGTLRGQHGSERSAWQHAQCPHRPLLLLLLLLPYIRIWLEACSCFPVTSFDVTITNNKVALKWAETLFSPLSCIVWTLCLLILSVAFMQKIKFVY